MRSSSRAALILVAAGIGCAPSNPGIAIEGIIAVPESCVVTVSTTGSFLAMATLDTDPAFLPCRVSGPDFRYTSFFQVANRMLNLGNVRYPLMADPNSWRATEAEVELRDTGGAALGGLSLSRYRVPAFGLVQSASADTRSLGVVSVELIPPSIGDELATMFPTSTILVAVRLTGVTDGGSVQQTGEFTFPLVLCQGCMYDCLVDSSGTPQFQLTCLPGQDRIMRACAGACDAL